VRLRMKSSSTCEADVERETRSCGPPISSAIIDHDRSRHEHDVDAAGLCLGVVVGEAGPGSATMHKATVSIRKKTSSLPEAARRRRARSARNVGAREAQRGQLADAPAQEGVNRQQPPATPAATGIGTPGCRSSQQV